MSKTQKHEVAKGSHRHLLQEDGTVRVWSSVGTTIAVTSDPPQFLKVEFGHERIAKNDSVPELKAVEKEIDDFNEEVLERHIRKMTRLIKRVGKK